MFPKDTLIAMSDGTERSIRSIGPGMMVVAGDGQPARVEKVISNQYEGSLIAIEYQDEGFVVATLDQPFITDRGSIFASMLVPGDKLVTPDTSGGEFSYWDVLSVRTIPYRGSVGDLVLDRDGRYVAGDVLVGHATA